MTTDIDGADVEWAPLGSVGGIPDVASFVVALTCFLEERCASYTVCLE
jgi:hypothetical protein